MKRRQSCQHCFHVNRNSNRKGELFLKKILNLKIMDQVVEKEEEVKTTPTVTPPYGRDTFLQTVPV